MSRKAKDQTKALDIPFTLMTQGDLVQEALAVVKDQALNIPVKVPLGGGRYAELTNGMVWREWIWDFGKPIRFLRSMVSACLCHSGKSCAVLRKWWTIWSVERKTENPWTGDSIWDKTHTLSSKPLNWRFHHFVPNGEWTLHPTKRGVTLSLYQWKELKKTIPLFEEREPELTLDNV